MMGGVVGGLIPELSYVASGVASSAGASYTVTSVSFGAAHPTRHFILMVAALSFAPTSATIGGVAATSIASASSTDASSAPRVAIYIAKVPTGTSGNITITVSSPAGSITYGLYRCTGLRSAAPTAVGADSSATTSLSLGIQARGVMLGASAISGGASRSWSGLATNFNAVASPVVSLCGGSYTATTAEGAHAASCATASNGAGCGVALR